MLVKDGDRNADLGTVLEAQQLEQEGDAETERHAQRQGRQEQIHEGAYDARQGRRGIGSSRRLPVRLRPAATSTEVRLEEVNMLACNALQEPHRYGFPFLSL